ncbi:MAG: hypothetical protein JHC68_00005, partial [Polynucleobacter sp.]|nr:hypothetical protein [Polynucleobacter sp.]
ALPASFLFAGGTFFRLGFAGFFNGGFFMALASRLAILTTALCTGLVAFLATGFLAIAALIGFFVLVVGIG